MKRVTFLTTALSVIVAAALVERVEADPKRAAVNGSDHSVVARRPGYVMQALPPGHVTVTVNGANYYYARGVYYSRHGAEYVVVAAPAGALHKTLPSGHVSVTHKGRTYHFFNGNWYLLDAPGRNYKAVAAPVGATVEFIPDGYQTIIENGVELIVYAGVRYRPVTRRGRRVFVVF